MDIAIAYPPWIINEKQYLLAIQVFRKILWLKSNGERTIYVVNLCLYKYTSWLYVWGGFRNITLPIHIPFVTLFQYRYEFYILAWLIEKFTLYDYAVACIIVVLVTVQSIAADSHRHTSKFLFLLTPRLLGRIRNRDVQDLDKTTVVQLNSSLYSSSNLITALKSTNPKIILHIVRHTYSLDCFWDFRNPG